MVPVHPAFAVDRDVVGFPPSKTSRQTNKNQNSAWCRGKFLPIYMYNTEGCPVNLSVLGEDGVIRKKKKSNSRQLLGLWEQVAENQSEKNEKLLQLYFSFYKRGWGWRTEAGLNQADCFLLPHLLPNGFDRNQPVWCTWLSVPQEAYRCVSVQIARVRLAPCASECWPCVIIAVHRGKIRKC